MDSTPGSQRLRGDAPKTHLSDDEFGLTGLVKALARASSSQISADGYVIGVEGKWGSGKTTLVHFLAEELSESAPHQEVLFFDPWLAGEKSAALAFFLGLLAAKIESVQDAQHDWWRVDYWIWKRFRKTLSEQIKKYGKYAAALSAPVGSLSAIDPSGAISLAAVGLKSFGWITRILGLKDPSAAGLKQSIAKQLRALQNNNPNFRIIVIIDDTDRLEPAEAAEVLRLVRKVADFPLLTYFVCFDRDVLAHQLETALQVKDGALYIDKIFQNLVSVPPQEPFALRRYLRKMLATSFPSAIQRTASYSHDEQYQEHVVLDIWAGRFLETPRDVVRLHEGVVFGWPNISDKCNFLDFVWLQLIKLKCPDLYKWTQDYLTNIAAYRDGGRPGDTEPSKAAAELNTLLGRYGWSDKTYISGISTILPGIASFSLEGEKRKVYQFGHDELATFERDGRLGSPSHWRQYFAFDLPTYAVSDNFISQFRLAIAKNRSKAVQMLDELLVRPHPRRGHFVDVLFDRLLDAPENSFSKEEQEGYAIVFSETMDHVAAETRDIQEFGSNQIWRKSLRLLTSTAASKFVSLIKTGKAINWLAEALRDQGYAHGLPEGRKRDESRQWLTKEQLDSCIRSYTRRVMKTDYHEIFTSPAPLDILFLILQLGDKKSIQSYVQKATRSKEGLLTVLHGMCSWLSSSSTGISHPLHREYVELFIDADKAKKRLQAISKNDPDTSYKLQAQLLLKEWSDRRIG
jgi:KAP family P-loop domain